MISARRGRKHEGKLDYSTTNPVFTEAYLTPVFAFLEPQVNVVDHFMWLVNTLTKEEEEENEINEPGVTKSELLRDDLRAHKESDIDHISSVIRPMMKDNMIKTEHSLLKHDYVSDVSLRLDF